MIKQVIFDWKRTLYDPDKEQLLDGAVTLLEFLSSKAIDMVLVGKGGEDMHQEVTRLGVEKYFSRIIFAEGPKDIERFKSLVSENNPKSICFIGDRVRSELEIGNKLGAQTIWVKQGKFSQELPINSKQQPGYIVSSLSECLDLLKNLT